MQRFARLVPLLAAGVFLFGSMLSGCSCGYPNNSTLPDNDSVESITLDGPDCNDRATSCSAHYASGRCSAMLATANPGSACVLRVKWRDGYERAFYAEYYTPKGCFQCNASTLADATVQEAIDAPHDPPRR